MAFIQIDSPRRPLHINLKAQLHLEYNLVKIYSAMEIK